MAKNKVASGKIQKKTPPQPAAAAAAASAKKLSEIDDIFAARPKEQPKTQPDAVAAVTNPKTKPATKSSSNASKIKVVDASQADKLANPQKQQKAPPKADDDIFSDSRGKNSKYTDDGMRVFYLDDLHIGEGEGDTELCPFDCKCCF
ncbi:hypothetical protein LPJ53_004919 [Coemansia erecta]|uniref:DUF1764-domain-containing protein n=1 Tax=Coemansia erecta TaxID=147472 RepID=A0A9W7XYQ3_9FUNG|nr:hypothetical protein LPJ53_004919 [Coemansia erecta]